MPRTTPEEHDVSVTPLTWQPLAAHPEEHGPVLGAYAQNERIALITCDDRHAHCYTVEVTLPIFGHARSAAATTSLGLEDAKKLANRLYASLTKA